MFVSTIVFSMLYGKSKSEMTNHKLDFHECVQQTQEKFVAQRQKERKHVFTFTRLFIKVRKLVNSSKVLKIWS
jgi:hypothetical protein